MEPRPAFAGFADPVNPGADELRAWGYDPAAGPPPGMQDWDLLLASDELAPTLLELAADPLCPKRTFALHCLYLYCGDAVRTGFRAHPRRRVRKLLDQGRASQDPWVMLWVDNTKALIADPNRFDYQEWCEGGLARRPRRL